MALTIIGNEVMLPGQIPDGTEICSSHPLDEKILGGIALSGVLVPEVLDQLEERVQSALEIMQQDESREFGACLAYGINLEVWEERQIDERLFGTLSALGGASLSDRERVRLEHPSMQAVMWIGSPGNRILKLNKHTGPIVMSDGTVPEGAVYSLLSRARAA